MSTLGAGVETGVLSIKKWLGVNESTDGDAQLKPGEAAEMVNFCITDSGALALRPGTKNIAGLMPESGYDIARAEETTLVTELNTSERTFEVWSECALGSVGLPETGGSMDSMDADSWESKTGWFIAENGKIYEFSELETGANADTEGAIRVEGGYVKISETPVLAYAKTTSQYDYLRYSIARGYKVNGGKIVLEGDKLSSTDPKDAIGWYISVDADKGGRIFKVTSASTSGSGKYYGTEIAYAADTEFRWRVREITGAETAAASPGRALWRGFVGDEEKLCAACSGRLWSLKRDGDVWSKTEVGSVSTESSVFMFGSGRKLYVLDGKNYKVWDGNSFSAVEGYIPCVRTSTPPGGGGKEYERVNLLTPKKSQRFSSDGSATTFRLCEKNVHSIDRVEKDGELVAEGYTTSAADGTVTFSAAPKTGIDNIQIWWTSKSGSRQSIVKMRWAEFFNGGNDSRVFFCGDGTNRVVYSGLDEDGNATAEYFPEKNELKIGEENTPVTSIIRHYNRLLVFKTDGAYSVSYETTILPDMTAGAGFYLSPLNRETGNDAPGQVVLVENRPRTFSNGGIYEWSAASSYSSLLFDQRNAKLVSQKAAKTLAGFDPKRTICWYDRLRHEYYVVCGGKAAVQNTENGAWFVYDGFPATAFVSYDGVTYITTEDGWLRELSRAVHSDGGKRIDAVWRSGSIDFDRAYAKKFSTSAWIGLAPEKDTELYAGMETEKDKLQYQRIAFSEKGAMRTKRLRVRGSGGSHCRLYMKSGEAGKNAIVTSADIRVTYSGTVR